ncbi:MAG: ABC transporter ATP-binding protein [Candidatus Diapherotrites archaeon]|nr:ABC transporter ATP-binding protein [Candidatus Diapherotrites archaeon]
MSAVTVENASKFFFQGKKKITALNGVSLEIKGGEIFGLLGPNGAGKTTLISSICGLLELDDGSIRVFGKNVSTQRKEVIREMNLVTGFAGLLYGMSVEDLLRYYAYLYTIPGKEKAISDALRLSGMEEKRKQQAFTLSSGYKQRFYIAKALLSSPRLLLMDEPTVGLDVEMAIKIRKLVKNLKKQGITILLTTHYMLEAEKLCDRIALINDGKIVATGTVDELKRLAGKPGASLEDTFLKLTRKPLEDEDDE